MNALYRPVALGVLLLSIFLLQLSVVNSAAVWQGAIQVLLVVAILIGFSMRPVIGIPIVAAFGYGLDLASVYPFGMYLSSFAIAQLFLYLSRTLFKHWAVHAIIAVGIVTGVTFYLVQLAWLLLWPPFRSGFLAMTWVDIAMQGVVATLSSIILAICIFLLIMRPLSKSSTFTFYGDANA